MKALPLLAPGLSIDVATVIVEDVLDLIRTNERLWWDDYVGLLNATCDRLPGELAQKKREAAFEAVASRLMEKAEREYESAVVIALVRLVQAMPIESREPYRKRAVQISLALAPTNLEHPTYWSNLRLVLNLFPILDDESCRQHAETLLLNVRDKITQNIRVRDKTTWDISNELYHLVKLAPRLGREMSRRCLHLYLDLLKRGEVDRMIMRYCLEGIEAVAPMLNVREDAELLASAYQSVLLMRPVADTHELSDNLESTMLALVLQMPPAEREDRLSELLRHELDRASRSTSTYEPWLIAKILERVSDSHQIAKLLDHPACVGPWRAAMLGRLENLCVPATFSAPWNFVEWKEKQHSESPK